MKPLLITLTAVLMAATLPSSARAETGFQKLGRCFTDLVACLTPPRRPPPAPPPAPDNIPPPQPLPPAPLPPPPPAPPPAYEAREFIVYFPFDSAVLDESGQIVLVAAANYAKSGNATRIVVVGHADTAGPDAYNIGLSERRAKATADTLVNLGISASTIAVDWKGESAPAVATGDGVSEPLNRRVTISPNF
ncbi:OmpA family protein [Caulobacter vibrioides]|uniref:OmpA family protein n=2 Tax=Caulobacter vibrioides TaxID=155892 RepID=Q9A4I6_CAUVC|nr:OmpA family protein [Caulobacter vibrioides]YP_002518311.1 outer membrane protein A [Caulobacter vibrioides NA1000]AAK24809.1 OmpA family protein [Caulobacter vibrioides CB15]ACL96403.1 outer membrane protein A [Caulobacter vibrioides NA1000]ATC29678.1 OmpA family protein [Caulobacter vibrioides]QXZ51198.1 OmpA family protein [Caulobacter vibrioides]